MKLLNAFNTASVGVRVRLAYG